MDCGLSSPCLYACNPVTKYSSPYNHEQEHLAHMSVMPFKNYLPDMKKLRYKDPDHFSSWFYSLNLKTNGFDIIEVNLVQVNIGCTYSFTLCNGHYLWVFSLSLPLFLSFQSGYFSPTWVYPGVLKCSRAPC